jgi:hypothetical protein
VEAAMKQSGTNFNAKPAISAADNDGYRQLPLVTMI